MFGTAVGSGYGSGLYGKYTRYENSFMYQTPNFNGVTAKFIHAPGNDSQYGTTTTGVTLRRSQNSEWGVSYANGPLAATGAQIRVVSTPNEASTAANITTTINTLGASYDLGFVKVGLGLQTVKADGTAAATNTDQSANNISIQKSIGATRVAFNYGKLNNNNQLPR